MRLMRGYLNNWGGWVVVAILAAMPLYAAQAAELKGARVWAGPEYTRVVLDASGPLRYTISQKDGQVVVDLPGSRTTSSFSSPSAQGLYRGMSHARIGDGMQLTAKVAPASRLKSFVLKPASGTDYRLVLDLYPASASVATVAPAEAAPTPVVQAPAAVPSYSNPTHSQIGRASCRERV